MASSALVPSYVHVHFINPENFNEDQKKIYSEYNDTSSKCECTLEQVKEVAAETER